jgi:hypothetical protein
MLCRVLHILLFRRKTGVIMSMEAENVNLKLRFKKCRDQPANLRRIRFCWHGSCSDPEKNPGFKKILIPADIEKMNIPSDILFDIFRALL